MARTFFGPHPIYRQYVAESLQIMMYETTETRALRLRYGDPFVNVCLPID